MSRRLGALALALVMLWPAVVWPDVITYPSRTTIAATFNVDGLCLDAANQDACLIRDAANALALANALTAQRFSVYNTRTDASNYERLDLGWSGDEMYINTAQAGSGSGRGLTIGTKGNGALTFKTNDSNRWSIGSTSGHWLSSSDGTYNIGAAGATRPGYIYASKVVSASGLELNTASGVTLNNVVSVPGSSTGTLTNAPTATDPAVWIPITVNGVVRKIPAW